VTKQPSLFPEDPAMKRTISDAEKAGGPITIDDMPNNDMRLVAEVVSVDFALALLQHLGGMQLNIPKHGLKKIRDRVIREQYDGSNAKRLALRFNVTERYVQQVANGKPPKE